MPVDFNLDLDPSVLAAINIGAQQAQDSITSDDQAETAVESAVVDAGKGAIIAAAVGEIAVAVGTIIATGGDIVVGIATGIGAGAAMGAELGPIGAAVGAVIGFVAALIVPGVSSDPFVPVNPIKIFQTVVDVGGRICIEAIKNRDCAVAWCSWAATDDWTAFDSWKTSFLAGGGFGTPHQNGASARIVQLFKKRVPTDSEVEAFCTVVATLEYLRNYGSHNGTIAQEAFSYTVRGVVAHTPGAFSSNMSTKMYDQVHTELQHLLAVARPNKGNPMSTGKEQDLARGMTHYYTEIDEYGRPGDTLACTYRQAQLCVQAAFGTPIGAEDRKAGVLKPIDPLGKYGARTVNPPPMLPGSGLTLSLLQDHAFHALLQADILSGNDPFEPLPMTYHIATLAALNPNIMLNAIKGGMTIHDPSTGLAVAVTIPQPSWFERMLEWIEHLLHIGPHPSALEHARNPLAAIAAHDDNPSPTGYRPLIPRGAVKGGVFGYTLENGDEVIDGENYAEHSGMSDEDLIQMWMSDPVRSTVAFDLCGRHVDEECINNVLDAPQSCPELSEAFECIEQEPDSCPVAAIGLKLVRMKRDCEAAVARACAGDARAKEYVQEAVNNGGVLGRMASDYLILSELQPLQERAMQRPMSLAPQVYPSAE